VVGGEVLGVPLSHDGEQLADYRDRRLLVDVGHGFGH
jgi:hypothetical protein